MKSNNPVFARSDTFNGRGANAYGNPTYPGAGAYDGYGAPSTWSVGSPGPQVDTGRITIDSVVQKTALTLGVLVVAAGATWLYVGNMTDAKVSLVGGLAIGGALVGFALAMVNSFKRVISPALVLAYAVAEGVFIGAMSNLFEAMYPGIVLSAVAGTLMAFAGTLTAYKVLDIKVTDKFRRGVVAAMFAFVGVAMLDLVLGIFGLNFGFNGYGTLGLISSVVGVVLGVLMLILDFDYVEQAVAVGAPERESWRAAFGLTVTLVWLYIEILRILAILRGND
ncbi:MAG: Bax inhibitor-1/YccA family protein [Nocardioidaceae bacterium]